MHINIKRMLDSDLSERQVRNYEQIAMLQKAQEKPANDNFITDEPDMLATMIVLFSMAIGIYFFWHVMFEAMCALLKWTEI